MVISPIANLDCVGARSCNLPDNVVSSCMNNLRITTFFDSPLMGLQPVCLGIFAFARSVARPSYTRSGTPTLHAWRASHSPFRDRSCPNPRAPAGHVSLLPPLYSPWLSPDPLVFLCRARAHCHVCGRLPCAVPRVLSWSRLVPLSTTPIAHGLHHGAFSYTSERVGFLASRPLVGRRECDASGAPRHVHVTASAPPCSSPLHPSRHMHPAPPQDFLCLRVRDVLARGLPGPIVSLVPASFVVFWVVPGVSEVTFSGFMCLVFTCE